MYGVGKDKPSPKAQSRVITQRDFTVQENSQRQVLFEIYYDPQFYDLELLIESKDAGEVRSHLYRAQQSNIEISTYKGAKRVQVEIVIVRLQFFYPCSLWWLQPVLDAHVR